MIPDDIIKVIFSFNSSLRKTIPYHREKLKILLHECMKENTNYTLSKAIFLIFKPEMEMMTQRVRKMKKIMYFMKKYRCYQADYEYYTTSPRISDHCMMIKYQYNINSPPFLYECLLSGCKLPFCKSSTRCINFQDVVDMIEYCPESIKYNMGYARCRNGVSPMWAILANENVEVVKKQKIVKLLLKHGAKYTDTVYVNGGACSIRDDISSW